MLDTLLDAWLDLVLGSCCCACGAPGRALCAPCEVAMPGLPMAAWPDPTPSGLVRPSATAPYTGAVRAMVLAHKEQGRLALACPLGRMLALAALDAAPEPVAGLDLVPVPSHPAVVRERGHDPLLRVARAAAAELRRAGADARVARLLRVSGRRPGDQAGLDAAARAANLAGRFTARVAGERPRGTGRAGRSVVLVDDVITTGATLREAQRALEAAGIRPVGAAVVAATRRRRPSPGPRLPVTGSEG